MNLEKRKTKRNFRLLSCCQIFMLPISTCFYFWKVSLKSTYLNTKNYHVMRSKRYRVWFIIKKFENINFLTPACHILRNVKKWWATCLNMMFNKIEPWKIGNFESNMYLATSVWIIWYFYKYSLKLLYPILATQIFEILTATSKIKR